MPKKFNPKDIVKDLNRNGELSGAMVFCVKLFSITLSLILGVSLLAGILTKDYTALEMLLSVIP